MKTTRRSSRSESLKKVQNDLWFRNSPEAVLAVADGTLRLVAATDRARATLSLPEGDLKGHTLHDFFLPDGLQQVSEAPGGAELQSVQVRDYAGNLRECDLAISRVPDERVLLISIRDASARNKLLEQLRQAQKMEALGMLAGGIAHDFNNLLTIISGYSQMLMGSAQLTTERDRTSIEQVLKASERAADLTSQLLAFSRRQSIQPRVLELNRVVDQTSAMLRRLIGEDIELRIEKSNEAGRVHADAGQLQQMLMNLAINARDAMPKGGCLEIKTNCAQLGSDYVGQHLGVKPGRYSVLEVTDNGTGMDDATRRRIFEPFFTTKAQGKGTGLGLSTVYGIVRQCGGSVDLYTEPGQGTTFCVYLPSVEAAESDQKTDETESRGGHETVLLVEDEEGVRKMVHTALERKGYHVLVASGGSEALVVESQWDGPLDLIVTDVIMPQMNGRELAERLVERRPAAAVLFISGYAGNTLLSAGTLGRDSAFLQKPFTPVVLTTKVREMLDARRAGLEAAGS